jgi:hypothetical protein
MKKMFLVLSTLFIGFSNGNGMAQKLSKDELTTIIKKIYKRKGLSVDDFHKQINLLTKQKWYLVTPDERFVILFEGHENDGFDVSRNSFIIELNRKCYTFYNDDVVKQKNDIIKLLGVDDNSYFKTTKYDYKFTIRENGFLFKTIDINFGSTERPNLFEHLYYDVREHIYNEVMKGNYIKIKIK